MKPEFHEPLPPATPPGAFFFRFLSYPENGGQPEKRGLLSS